MLIDLEWDREQARGRVRCDVLTGFEVEAGGLVITCAVGGTDYRRRVATRLGPGVYRAHDLTNDIGNFTRWEAGCWLTELQAGLRAVEAAAADSEERSRLHRAYIRQCCPPEYGTADTLQQVFKRGRPFVASPHPFVLQVRYLDRAADGGFRFHKNGPYIGRRKRPGERLGECPAIDTLIQYTFLKLDPKPPRTEVRP